MLAKYEAVSKEKKVMQEEKSYYFQRKVDALDTELRLAKLSVKFADRVIDGVVPRFQDMFESPVTGNDRFECAFNVI